VFYASIEQGSILRNQSKFSSQLEHPNYQKAEVEGGKQNKTDYHSPLKQNWIKEFLKLQQWDLNKVATKLNLDRVKGFFKNLNQRMK
jgi:hypothetical protein